MKVFIAGASGRVAQELIKQLTAAGHQVLAGVRDVAKAPRGEGVQPLELDLHAQAQAMVPLLEGVDAIYFTAGSRGQDLLGTDAFGAVKLMQAAEQAGVKRFILLSSLYADQPQKWDGVPSLAAISNYNIAKFFADHWLMHRTSLDYTILQPTVLVEAEQADGLVQIPYRAEGPGQNSIPNVALVLAQLLQAPQTIGKVITMSDGPTPLAQALAQI